MGKLAVSIWATMGVLGMLVAPMSNRALAEPAVNHVSARASSPDAGAISDTRPPLATDSEAATLYALGQLIARTLGDFQLSADELDFVMQGVEDGVFGHTPRTDLAAQVPKLHAMQASRRSGRPVVALEGGILVQLLHPGDGEQPKDTDHVQVRYEGMLADGTVFESVLDEDRPAVFPVKGVIPCWTKALQAMRVGQKARVTCPPELAYGSRGVPPKIQPNAMLVFNIELVNIL
jgi:FKBP-type peptidyl-prolyl cis-trans isomerase FkpA